MGAGAPAAARCLTSFRPFNPPPPRPPHPPPLLTPVLTQTAAKKKKAPNTVKHHMLRLARLMRK